MIASGKEEFKFEEIQEMIESMAVLCYTNDLMHILIEDWIIFMDTYLCDYEGAQCGRDMSEPTNNFRKLEFFLFDPSWAMVQELITKNSSNYFYEKLMMFDDWEEHLPVITPKRVKTAKEAKIEFFSVPVERRNARLNYTVDYEDQTTWNVKKIKKSIWEFNQKNREGNWATPRFMD